MTQRVFVAFSRTIVIFDYCIAKRTPALTSVGRQTKRDYYQY